MTIPSTSPETPTFPETQTKRGKTFLEIRHRKQRTARITRAASAQPGPSSAVCSGCIPRQRPAPRRRSAPPCLPSARLRSLFHKKTSGACGQAPLRSHRSSCFLLWLQNKSTRRNAVSRIVYCRIITGWNVSSMLINMLWLSWAISYWTGHSIFAYKFTLYAV